MTTAVSAARCSAESVAFFRAKRPRVPSAYANRNHTTVPPGIPSTPGEPARRDSTARLQADLQRSTLMLVNSSSSSCAATCSTWRLASSSARRSGRSSARSSRRADAADWSGARRHRFHQHVRDAEGRGEGRGPHASLAGESGWGGDRQLRRLRQHVVSFLIVAFCVFLLVKAVNSMQRTPPPAAPAPTPTEALLARFETC